MKETPEQQRDRLIKTSIACFRKWKGQSIPTAFLDLAVLLDEFYLAGIGPAETWPIGGERTHEIVSDGPDHLGFKAVPGPGWKKC